MSAPLQQILAPESSVQMIGVSVNKAAADHFGPPVMSHSWVLCSTQLCHRATLGHAVPCSYVCITS